MDSLSQSQVQSQNQRSQPAIRNKIFCKKCETLSPTIDIHKRHKPDEIPAKLLENNIFEEVVGVGGYGAVFKCWDIELKIYKAIKIMFDIDENAIMDMKIMRSVNHQYMIKYYGEGKNEEEGCAWVSMELAEMDLWTALKKDLFNTEEKKLALFEKICEGVAYLHTEMESPIIHRDLKPQNILIIRGKPRITDFGISKLKRSPDPEKTSSVTYDAGTECYMPPELLGRKGNNFSTNDKHDIWSLGIMLHEIYTGKNPFRYDEFWNLNICKGTYKIDYQKIKKNSIVDILLKGCLTKDTNERFNIMDILRFFNKKLNIKEKEAILLQEVNTHEEEKKIDLSLPLQNPQSLLQKVNLYEEEKKIDLSIPINKKEKEAKKKDLSLPPQNPQSFLQEVNLYEEEKKMDLSLPSQNFKPAVQNQIKLKKLNQIISHLKNNNNYSIVYNYTEYWERSGIVKYFHKNAIPLEYVEDEMINLSYSGVLLLDLDLGVYDVEKIKSLGKVVLSNKTIQLLIIQDDKTLTNGNFENIKELSRAISQNESIIVLILDNNNLGVGSIQNIKEIFKSICSSFSSNRKNLTTLGLDNNNLGDGKIENVKTIFESICSSSSLNMKNLTTLWLYNNNLGSGNPINIEFIFNSISSASSILKNLTTLGLNNNRLGGGNFKNIEVIFKSFSSKTMNNLHTLWLENNNLGGGNIKNLELIFNSICSLKNLKNVYIDKLNDFKLDTEHSKLLMEAKKKRRDIKWI